MWQAPPRGSICLLPMLPTLRCLKKKIIDLQFSADKHLLLSAGCLQILINILHIFRIILSFRKWVGDLLALLPPKIANILPPRIKQEHCHSGTTNMVLVHAPFSTEPSLLQKEVFFRGKTSSQQQPWEKRRTTFQPYPPVRTCMAQKPLLDKINRLEW